LASAALLNDGRLFLIGEGYAVYDIAKRTFTDVTRREESFRFANKGRVIARLANGQVLIIGGFSCPRRPMTPERDLLFVRWPSSDSYGVVCSTGEVYDPAAPTFIPLGYMTIPRYFPSSTPLDNGDALIAGGFTGDAFTNRTEVYDSRTRKFVRTADMAMLRIGHTAVRLQDGRVLIAGGFSGADFTTSAEIFDPKTKVFIPTGSMLTGRECATATLLKSGKVLVAGGRNAGGILSEAELYDPRTGSFIRVKSMTVPRYFHTATMMRDGRVLVVGGASTIRTAAAEVYDPVRHALNPTVTFAPLLIGTDLRFPMRVWTRMANGMVLLSDFGPRMRGSSGGSIFVCNSDDHKCSRPLGNMNLQWGFYTATPLKDGRVLTTGGATAELYDPMANRLFPSGGMRQPRAHCTASLLPNGRVLVVGGWHVVKNAYQPVDGAELYDPTNGEFRPAGGTNAAHVWAIGITLAGGDVLIAGGNSDPPLTAEVYHWRSNRFTAMRETVALEWPEARKLRGGEVLILGIPPPG
jgi:Kelch motif